MAEQTQSTADETAETSATETTTESNSRLSEVQANLLAEAAQNPETASTESGPAREEEEAKGDGEKARPDKPAPDPNPGEETGEGDKGPEPRAPAEYAEFTVPEGLTFDEAGLTEFKSFAKEQDLTQEQAQRMLEFGGARLKAMVEAPYKQWSETQEAWKAEVKADPEIGGTKFEESIKNAALVFEPAESNPFVKSAEESKALREALNTTGAGNNPAMVKLFVKMGRLLAEPGPLSGKPVGADRQGDILAKMYPTMTGDGQ